jgi:CRISPR-associated exonuclease Cas4
MVGLIKPIFSGYQTDFWFLVAFFFIFLAFLLHKLAKRKDLKTGLPQGRVVYSDTSKWGKVEKPLFDPISGLAGKPDYLVQDKAGNLIPVELKSSWAPPEPYQNHVMQLAAYCLLVGRTTGKRPPYGLLKYRNRIYGLDFTAQMEADLLELVKLIRKQKQLEQVDRTHEDAKRCERCGFRHICSQRM